MTLDDMIIGSIVGAAVCPQQVRSLWISQRNARRIPWAPMPTLDQITDRIIELALAGRVRIAGELGSRVLGSPHHRAALQHRARQGGAIDCRPV